VTVCCFYQCILGDCAVVSAVVACEKEKDKKREEGQRQIDFLEENHLLFSLYLPLSLPAGSKYIWGGSGKEEIIQVVFFFFFFLFFSSSFSSIGFGIACLEKRLFSAAANGRNR
jgi:hypothetical protein